MTKQHFIALADVVRLEILPRLRDSKSGEIVIDELARFCKSQNGRFDESRWRGYIAGTNGPNGGSR